MQFRTRTWFIISLLFFVAAAVFWQLGERKLARDKAAKSAASGPAAAGATAGSPVTNAPIVPAGATNASVLATNANDPLRFRLSNTTLTERQLLDRDPALLLMNALVDTASPLNLPIPAHLRAQGDPGVTWSSLAGR